MICRNCGKEFEGRFCPECGSIVDDLNTCPNCGSQRMNNGKYCVNCGYNFEDPAQSARKRPSNRNKKPINKAKVKKLVLRIGVPVLVVAVLLAIIIPSVTWTNNIFRIGKVDKINIGDSQEQVINVLGEPYKKNGYTYEYYSKDYLKLLEKIEKMSDVDDWDIDEDTDIDDAFEEIEDNFDKITKLEEELETMVYKYICVEFDNDKKVSSVLFDAEKCDSKEYKKTVKEFEVQGETALRQYDELNLTYSVGYDDGSLFKGIAVNKIYTETEDKPISWTDRYNNNFEVNIEVNPITELTSYMVERIAGGDKLSLTEFELTENIRYIDSDAFYGCDNLTKIIVPTWAISKFPKSNLTTVIITSGTEIDSYEFDGYINLTRIEVPITITHIGQNAFRDCSNLTIYCEASSKLGGWDSYWNYSNRPVVWGYNNITTDIDYDYVVRDDKVYLTKYKESNNQVTVPQIIEDREVVSIGNIFAGNKDIKELVLSSSITSIDSYAFSGCSSITSIEIPSSVTSIGDGVFSGCSSLKSIVMPSEITSIGSSAFSGCSSITSIEISNSVTSIGSYAFYECSSLTSIEIPSGVTSIGSYAFYECSSLTSIEIPSGVTSIDRCAFSGCSSLASIDMSSGLTSIGYNAFYGCSSLTSIEIPSGVTNISDDAFYGCGSLKGVYITDLANWCAIKLDSYYANPLYYAHNLYLNNELVTELKIPSGGTSIGEYAFSGCSSLTSVIIPSSFTRVGNLAFYECLDLTIYCEAGEEPSGWDSAWARKWGNWNEYTAIWGYNNIKTDSKFDYVVHDNKVYLTKYKGSYSEVIVPQRIDNKEVVSIGAIFAGNEDIVSIEMPNSVTSLGENTFFKCNSLARINIPIEVTHIDSYAFYGCWDLTIYCETNKAPNGWGNYWNFYYDGHNNYCPVIRGYNNITSDSNYDYVERNGKVYLTKYKGDGGEVIVPKAIDNKEVVSIGNIFADEYFITSITIPYSVISINQDAFESCNRLQSVIWEGHPEYVYKNPFLPDDPSDLPPSNDADLDGDDSGNFDSTFDILKYIPFVQLAIIAISIILAIAFMATGASFAKKCKKIKRDLRKYNNIYAGAVGLFGLSTTSWTVMSLVFMGLSALSFVFMITQIIRYKRAKSALNITKENYALIQQETDGVDQAKQINGQDVKQTVENADLQAERKKEWWEE